MDLAELKFVVNTEDLERAAKEVAKLGTEVSKLNKPMQELTRESAKTNKELSKAEESAAKAALAQHKLEQAQTKSTDATRKSASVLERQNLILEYMAQGNSKGQASILATAKAAGALDDEMLELNKTLVTQRTLIGGDPFDKSIGLMQKLQNEYKTTTEVTNLFNKNLGLTEKQMTDLAREKERLIALYGIEGKSLDNLGAEYDQLIQKSAMINRANDARTNSMKAQVKAQNDAAKANEYISNEMERLNRLTASNGDLTSATNNKIIRFEKELRASGMSAAQASIQLEDYKQKILATQKAAGNRQIDYLSRALGPQITDIAVGLATGQAPLTILLQQGGQLRDQFALAGVAGKDMGDMLTKATLNMVDSVKDVGIAVGGAIGGAFLAAGKGTNKFIGDITGISSLLENLRYQIALMEGSSGPLMNTFKGLTTAITFMTTAIVAGALVALVAYGVALKEVITQESALSKAINLTGGSLGLTTDSALALSEEYAASKGNIGSYVEAITEIAKAGNVTSDNLKTVATTIVDVSRVTGISADTLAKNFSKISEKPLEGLIPFAKELGTINVDVLKYIQKLQSAGKYTEAAKVATEAYAGALRDAAKAIKQDMGFLEDFFFHVARGAKMVWNEILNIGRATPVAKKLVEAQKELASLQAGEGFMTDQYRKNSIQVAKASIEGLEKQIAAQKKLGEEKAKNNSDIVAFEKTLKDKPDEPAKIDDGFASALESAKKFYEAQVGAVENLTKSEIALNKVREDANYKKFTPNQKKQIDDVYEQAKANELLVKAEKDRTNQMDAIAALTGKSDGFGKQYYETLKLLDEAYTDGNISLEKHIELVNILYHTTPQVKARQDAINKANDAQKKADDALGESWKVLEELNKQLVDQTDLLALEGSLIGATDAERKKALANKRLDLQLEKEIADIKKRSISKEEQDAQIASAEQRRLEAGKNVNTEIANDFAKKQFDEFDRISTGLADAAMTGLFEGGKEGSKKFRALLEAELKKPITVIVKALIETGMNALVGGGSKGGSFAESIVGSFLQKQVGSIAVGGTTLGAAAGAFGQGVVSGFSMGAPVASMGSATSASFNAGATYGAPVAGAIGGIAANRAISQDYEISKTMTKLQDVATVAAAFIPGLGPLVALGVGVVSGLANRAFGMKAKEITGEGIVGVLTTQGADVKAFEDWFQKGGWFRKSKSGRNLSAVSASLQEYLDVSLVGVTASTKAYAVALGLEAKDIDGVTKAIDLNLKGLSAEDRQKKIDEALGGFSDELAKKLGFESFDALQKLGEEVLKQRYDLETQLLTLQGDTNTLRARERDQIYETNQALFDQIKALEDAKPILEEKTKLEQELAILQGKTTQGAIERRELLSEENRQIYDQIEALKDKQKADEKAAEAMQKLTDVTTTIVDEINRLRGVNTSKSGLESQFAILTAQARSGDLNALAQLPEVTKGLEQIAASTAVNATDIIFARARLAQSLQDTLDYTGGFTASATTSMASIGSVSASGTSVSSNVTSASSNQELLAAMVIELQGLRAEVRADVSHNAKTAKILERANQDGETLSVSATIDGGVV